MKLRPFLYFLLLLTTSILLSGCNLFSGGKEEIDPPQSVSYEDDLDVASEDGTNDAKKDSETTVQTELFLIDKNGYVVPRTFNLPAVESRAKQALEHLVVGGPITEYLPNDFRAVLPADTELTVDIQDGVATVNFSKEFAEYDPADEKRILQAVTWTLTQFDSVDTVKLKLNGNELKEMPVNGTPIHTELSRKDGINIVTSNVIDITNTRPVTVYYIAQTDTESYYVPITKRVSNKKDNLVQAIVEELVKGPDISSELFTLFMPDVKLLDEPKIKDGIVNLNFNENISGSYDEILISKQVLDTLVLSLTEQEEIEGVSIEVNGDANIVGQDGDPMTKPVTRPKNVNTGSF